MIKKYIKKPVEIEAVKFTNENKDQIYSWATEIQMNISHSWDKDNNPCLIIPTLEGEMTCSLGDYLIKESFPTDRRKIYPCKEEIFLKTYQAVLEPFNCEVYREENDKEYEISNIYTDNIK